MRKCYIFVSLFICALILCGCESKKEDRTKIVTALKSEKIISDSMKQIDVVTYKHYAGEMCNTENYYIYKDKDGKMIAITFQSNRYAQNSDYDHLVEIYENVTINDSVNKINSEDAKCDDDGYFKYENGEYTENNKYELGESKSYYATKNDKGYSLEFAK